MSTGGGGSPSPAGHGGMFGSSGAGGFGYGVVVSVGILLLLAIIAFAAFYFCCARTAPTPGAGAPRHGDEEAGGGVDEATLEAYPAMAYGELRKKQRRRGQEETEACCPVCLESYGEADVVRALPECGHVFHRGCVDPWLRRRATCPVCRTSPLPSPLAEVTPLALARPSS